MPPRSCATRRAPPSSRWSATPATRRSPPTAGTGWPTRGSFPVAARPCAAEQPVPVDARRVRLRAESGANRAAIVAEAEIGLCERPFREVSDYYLMQAAGLARTQFYRYVDDLSDLVVRVAAGVL